MVVVVAGLSGLGKSLTAEFVHRPEIFSHLAGLPLAASITPAALIRILTHPAGGLKNIPSSARRVVLLNQADTPAVLAQGKLLAEELIPPMDAVIIASLAPPALHTSTSAQIHAVIEPVAGIILAAGEAKRFGRPKQLLEYRGQPFVRCVVQSALTAGLSPVVVVTGANADDVEAALLGLPVKTARNQDWQSGQSSSIRTGLQTLPANIGAGLFLLADQPQISPAVIRALMERHAQDLAPVVAPLVAGKRANPVLFDRFTFPSLTALTGDVGGRAIFSQYPPAYLTWLDESLLVDIDTPADLKKLESME
jgi:molybdenum cofactor cytidylyltransferase